MRFISQEINSLFNKYKINIKSIQKDGTVYLERYGIVIPYNQRDLHYISPKIVVKDVILMFIKSPNYKEKMSNYIRSLVKKDESKDAETLLIENKKKIIREKLIKDGIL